MIPGERSLRGRPGILRSRRAIGRTIVGLTFLASGVTITACGTSAQSLAQQACTHIDASLKALHRANSESGNPSAVAADRQVAYQEILAAVPITAQAARLDGQWQALEFTTSEINRVPEATLEPSLRAQCAATERSVFDQQPPPTAPPVTPATQPETAG